MDRTSVNHLSFQRVGAAKAVFVAAGIAALAAPAGAGTYYYDANTGTAGTGGTGSWNLSTLVNWRDTTPTGTLVRWPGSTTSPAPPLDLAAVAVFGDVAGTVTLGGSTINIIVNRLDFEVSGFSINPNAGSFLNFSGTAPAINVINAGHTANVRVPFQGSVEKTGVGTLILSYFSGSPQANHAPTAVTVSSGTLRTGSIYSFGTGTTRAGVSLGAGTTLDLNGLIATVGGAVQSNAVTSVSTLNGVATSVVTNSPTYLPTNTAVSNATLQIGAGSSAASNFAGVIQDGTHLTRLHVGVAGTTPTATLTGANIYTGGTEIQSGNFVLDDGGSIIAANTTITGGTLTGGASGFDGTINFRIANDVSDLISITAGTLALPNLTLNLVLSGTQTLPEYVLANKPVGSAFVTGTVFGNESLPAGWNIDYNGTVANPNSIVLVAPVPEPSAAAAFGLAMAATLLRRRRLTAY